MKEDLRGLSCPIPVLKAKKALTEHNQEESFEFVLDCGAACENVSRLARKMGFNVEAEKKDDGVKLIFTRQT